MSEKVRKPRLIISSDEEKTIVQHREELTMAKRPVFIAKETAPFYQMTEIKFEWNGGLAKVQKQKNITALHQEFLKKEPDKKVLENEKLAAAVLEYDAFTDIEFNPDRSLNCQAKAAACFVGLCRAGLTEKMKTFETFAELFGPVQKVQVQSEETETKPEMEVKIGDRIKHKLFGNGTVVAAGETSLSVEFEKVGRKKLGKQWCLKNCEVTSENNK